MGVADNVVKSLLQKLFPLAADEVKSLWGVKEQMESLHKELKFVEIFLKNSDGKRYNPIVKEVVNQIRDVAYKAEDVVDIYTSKVSDQQEFRCMLEQLFHIIGHMIMLHGVSVDIGKIKSSIDKIYKNMDRYNIGEEDFKRKDNEVAQSLHRRRRNVDEEDVVHDSTVVIKELEKTCLHRTVVSIIGMGGLGKTTLAKKIYNTDRIKHLFPCRAWGDVSNDYRPEELLLNILKCVGNSNQYKDLRELKKKVRECLEGKKYLIVLDDIWETMVWDEVQDAFPGDSGGRILITSRNMEVAYHSRATLAYELPFLNKEDSWKLFSRKVFQEEECPSDLVDLGESMLQCCGGVPLAIIVLAGVAAIKKSQREWSRIKDRVNRRLAHDQKTIVMDILKLSYDHMPRELKPCFLYFAMYPKDREIHVKQLIQLWIAEGFIQVTEHSNPPKLEDVAEYYLDELVDLSLVQVARRRRSDGSVKTCRIHDLLHDLCISESRDEKFLDVCTSASSNPRRLSCQCIKGSCITSNNERYQSCIRSFICFGKRKDTEFHQKNTMKSVVERFKLARVLDFRLMIILQPNDLKTLIHLRYLTIRVPSSDKGRREKEIPACIFSLYNLQVLMLYGFAYIERTMMGMWKLKQLRHLHTDYYFKLIADMSKPEIEIMSNLQTLHSVQFGPQTPSILNNDRFPKLIKLSLEAISYARDEAFQRLSHLSNLRTLKIYGDLEIQSNAAFLSNLTKITLDYRNYAPSVKTLAKLTKLEALTLESYGVYDISFFNIKCRDGDFPNLKMFRIIEVGLTGWTLSKGAMPRLERLFITACYWLKDLPKELWSLTSLEKVKMDRCYARDNSLENGMVMKNGCKIII